MFDRLKRSFTLVGASAQVLRQDNHLLLFPIISGVAMLLVVVAFALPLFGLVAGAVVLTLLLAKIAAAPALFVVFAIVVVLVSLGCILLHATLSGIYSAVLYRYAVGGSDAPGFDGGVLAAAFQRKS